VVTVSAARLLLFIRHGRSDVLYLLNRPADRALLAGDAVHVFSLPAVFANATLRDRAALDLCMLQSAPMPNLDNIIQQLRDERGRLDRAIADLESMADSTAPRRAGRRSSARTRRRTMSLAARRRIAAAQRARWKRVRAGQRSVNERSVGRKAGSRSSRGRRHLSPEALARISAAQRKRWAKVRAGKKK